MSYSIATILHPHANKDGLQKVIIQVIYKRMKVYVPTVVRVSKENFNEGNVIKHPLAKDYNTSIKELSHAIERRLLDLLNSGKAITPAVLKEAVHGSKEEPTRLLTDFIYDLCDLYRDKLSEGRLNHYRVMAGKLEKIAPGATFKDVSVQWLNKIESRIREGVAGNTVNANMLLLKSIMNKAFHSDLIGEKQFKSYRPPKYVQPLPEYLTEDELDKFFALIKVVEKPAHKLAGYYYMLSCLTGYRISDVKQFDYSKMVQGNNVVLRAKKNKSIVSIPIYPKLREVLDFVKDKPIDLSEQKMREYVKEMFLLVGVKKDVSWHSSRHYFAMMLMSRGFSVDEVGELIGDTSLIAKVYARIHNDSLNKKILERLG